MIVVRGLLFFIFSLLAAFAVYLVYEEPASRTNWTGLATFLVILAILGPAWPSPSNFQRWGAGLNRILGIDNATPVLVNGLCALYSAYNVWDTYAHPGRQLHDFEKVLAAFFGTDGVLLAWVIIFASCAYYAIRAYRVSKEARRSDGGPSSA